MSTTNYLKTALLLGLLTGLILVVGQALGAAAHSRAVARMSEDIAAALRALQGAP